jgi:hypothetical protein
MSRGSSNLGDATDPVDSPAPAAGAGGATDSAPHRPAGDTEEVYYEGSPQLRGDVGHMVAHFLVGLVLIALPFVVWGWRHKMPPWWSILVLLLAGVAFALGPVVKLRTIRYRITNYRIDYERGLISKTIDTLELWHVEDLRFHQTLFDRMLDVGTITIISHDETIPRLELRSLPNPRPLFETLKQRVIAVKRQRGVIKMDVG